MARRQRLSGEQGSHGGHDGGSALRWLLTYADMITLLMAFFIMLYSMSILNLNKFREVAVSIRSGFGGLMEGQSHSIIGSKGKISEQPAPVQGKDGDVPWIVVRAIQRFVEKESLGQSVKLRVDERGLVISLVTDKVVFAKGQADLTPAAKRIIGGIADTLGRVNNPIRVEGHTCNLPVASEKYPSNWELSTARAATVVRFLIEQGDISTQRLSASGYADSKPLAPNTNDKNRTLNRRVDIVVLRDGYRDGER